ncbi:MAG: kelch repeat-containing protein, partial [Myxococcaceae bacterium]
VQASASASFLNASHSDAFSISAIYTGTYFFKNRIFKNPKLNIENQNMEQWREACGTEFVEQQSLGAKLFFSIRIDFLSEEEKNSFAASFSFDTPLASASASVHRAVANLSKKTRVTINVLQIGGKVDRITEIFQTKSKESKAYQFVQCSSGQLEQCQKVLEQAVSYATDTDTGFPSQISPDFLSNPTADGGPAVLSSTTQSYRTANIFIEVTPELNSQIKLSRQLISQKYETAYKQYTRVGRLTRDGVIRLSPRQREKFVSMENHLFDFLQRAADASMRCYETPKQCGAADEDLSDSLYNESDFLVEPEIFSQYCDLGQSPLAQKSLSSTIVNMLRVAQQLEPDLFIPPYEGATVDVCHAAELVYARATSLSFSGIHLEDLRPLLLMTHLKNLDLSDGHIQDFSRFSTFINLEKLDMRNNEPGAACPFADKTRCIQADFRTNNSFIPIHKTTQIPRISHTATQLDNDDILIAGGMSVLRAEIYDAKTGEFRLIGEQCQRRYYHSATKLNNGNVLLVGGFGKNASESAEVFEHHGVKFSLTAQAPLFNRAQHTATLLSDGRVLIVGGWSNTLGFFTGMEATSTVEIYDPQTQRFTQVDSMNTPRASHRAILLKNNKVLITGGYAPEGSLTTAEIYDPVKNEWLLVNSHMHYGRSEHTATLLQNGHVLIAGGFTNQAEIFDPKTETFNMLAHTMNESRGEHEALPLSDGRVVIFGGRQENLFNVDLDGKTVEGGHATAEIFDPNSMLFTKLGKQMMGPRTIFTATQVTPNRILLVGGMGGLASYSAELFEYAFVLKQLNFSLEDSRIQVHKYPYDFIRNFIQGNHSRWRQTHFSGRLRS